MDVHHCVIWAIPYILCALSSLSDSMQSHLSNSSKYPTCNAKLGWQLLNYTLSGEKQEDGQTLILYMGPLSLDYGDSILVEMKPLTCSPL